MSIYISDDLILTDTGGGDVAGFNSPRIGIQNISNKSNIAPSSANTLESNPSWLTSIESTAERWKTTPADFHVWGMTSDGVAEVDYIGIAAHRGLIGRQIEIRAVVDGVLQTVFGPQLIVNTDPIFVLFDVITPTLVYIQLQSDTDFNFEIGIINVGKSVFLPRNIYVGHTPITYGRRTTKQIATSDSGAYLGQRLTKISKYSSVTMDNIRPLFYRDYLFRFFHLPSEIKPFFWAWRPNTYPDECGFCWVSGDINVQNSKANGDMSMSFDITGFVNNG